MKNYVVTYPFLKGIASKDFDTIDQALFFAKSVRGARIYVRNSAGSYVPYKAGVCNG